MGELAVTGPTSLKNWLRAPVRLLLRVTGLHPYYRLGWHSSLCEIGWFQSFRLGLPVDNAGNPLPWYTYPAISFLAGRVGKSFSVFEYGAGHSTLWWAARVLTVKTCEHDQGWAETIRKRSPPNATIEYVALEPEGDYSRAIARYKGQFEVIVVDGRNRVECAKNCLAALKPNGVVIWDNSERERYAAGYEFLRQRGFRRLDFQGMGPVIERSWCTSIFYRQENCLGI